MRWLKKSVGKPIVDDLSRLSGSVTTYSSLAIASSDTVCVPKRRMGENEGESPVVSNCLVRCRPTDGVGAKGHRGDALYRWTNQRWIGSLYPPFQSSRGAKRGELRGYR